MSISSDLFGRELWHTIYAIVFGYPAENASPEHRKAALDFFTSLSILFPCDKCKIHFNSLLEQFPIHPHLENSHALSQWVYKLHSETNKNIGKTCPPYETIRSQFFSTPPPSSQGFKIGPPSFVKKESITIQLSVPTPQKNCNCGGK